MEQWETSPSRVQMRYKGSLLKSLNAGKGFDLDWKHISIQMNYKGKWIRLAQIEIIKNSFRDQEQASLLAICQLKRKRNWGPTLISYQLEVGWEGRLHSENWKGRQLYSHITLRGGPHWQTEGKSVTQLLSCLVDWGLIEVNDGTARSNGSWTAHSKTAVREFRHPSGGKCHPFLLWLHFVQVCNGTFLEVFVGKLLSLCNVCSCKLHEKQWFRTK